MVFVAYTYYTPAMPWKQTAHRMDLTGRIPPDGSHRTRAFSRPRRHMPEEYEFRQGTRSPLFRSTPVLE